MKRWLLLMLVCATCGRAPQQQEKPPGNAKPGPAQSEQGEPNLPGKPETVIIYYRHPTLEGILPCKREIIWHANMANQVKQVIDYLTIPPENGEGEVIWPENTYVREVFLLEDGTVVIDFDSSFLSSISAGATQEEFLVYSLVNSVLENFAPYDKVRILIDGEQKETFLGHIDIEYPLVRRYNLYTILPDQREEEQIIHEEILEEGDGPTQPIKNSDQEMGF